MSAFANEPEPHPVTGGTSRRRSGSGVSRRVLLGGVGTAAIGLSVAGGLAASRPRGMPSFAGASAWLGSPPLTPADLSGQVVLVQFWTFTCINWIRTAPYVRAWWEAYRDDGLVVIGVHTPEFSFEHDLDLVRRAVAERGIEHPVVVDNDYRIWNAFANNYWPALYFLDREGRERHHVFGEGAREDSERRIQSLLGVDRDPAHVTARGVEAEADWGDLRSSETYLGHGGGFGTPPEPASDDEPNVFAIPAELPLGRWGLDGEWSIAADHAVLVGDGGRIALRFLSRDVHLVLRSVRSAPVPFRVTIDGDSPGDSHGVDVGPGGDGVLREARLYQLVRVSGPVRERLVEVDFSGSGVEAYAFTFG